MRICVSTRPPSAPLDNDHNEQRLAKYPLTLMPRLVTRFDATCGESVLQTVAFDTSEPAAAAAAILDAWKHALVVQIEPVRPIADVRASYEELLKLSGTPHHLAESVQAGGRDSDRTGEMWEEVRFDPAFPNAYRHSPNAQPLHTDGSYILSFPNATLMCCVTNAVAGGETVFLPGNDLVAALRTERPDLLDALMTTSMPHARSGDRRVRRVIQQQEGVWILNWNYYCVAPDCEPKARRISDDFFNYLRNSDRIRDALVDVKLRPGSAVVWKDEHVLHGRRAFVAQKTSERFLWKVAVDVGVFS